MISKFGSSAIFALNELNKNGFEAYLVGGSVRDCLMGKEIGDKDITTNATPEEIKGVFSAYKVINTGIKHGTVTVVINGEPFEITTYRCESGYSDNRHPDTVLFSHSFDDDVKRRDFTMNGIGLSVNGVIRDEVGGQRDIENKIIRAIGDPYERFNEDALRILRAVRFASVLGFTIEENTKKALHETKELLENVSAERKREELCKLICGKNAEEVLLLYRDVLAVCIPEIKNEFDFIQYNRHHIYDVYAHSVKALASSKCDKNIRMALLLHDIGKTHTARFDENGEQHFKCHAQVSEEFAKKILGDLRFSNADRDEILTLVKYHDIPFMCDDMTAPSKKRIKKIVAKFGENMALKLAEIRRCDNMAQNPQYFLGNEFYEECKRMITEVAESEECLSLRNLAIKGTDLIAMGIEGEEIGKMLNLIFEKVLDGELSNDRASLISFAEKNKSEDKKNGA